MWAYLQQTLRPTWEGPLLLLLRHGSIVTAPPVAYRRRGGWLLSSPAGGKRDGAGTHTGGDLQHYLHHLLLQHGMATSTAINTSDSQH